MNNGKMKKFATMSLSAMMVLGLTNSLSLVNAQDVKEGQQITINSSVGTMQAILNANINDYYENNNMRITKLQSDIYQVDEETTTHPADGPTNNPSSIYFIVGEKKATIIDGGNGNYNSNFDKVFMKDVVDTLVGDKELKVLITHSHGDHIGMLRDYGNEILSKDVPVYIHEDDFESLDAKVKENFTVKTLKDNDVVEAGGRTLRVVSEYGHTDGSVVYVDESDEVIFSGDTIGSGTVWLFGDNDLVEFDQSINKLSEIVKKMKNPIFYAGHRWQQSKGSAHATEKMAVNEMGKQYVYEMDALLDDVAVNKYSTTKPYNPSPNNVGIYSETSDKNKDGIYPGIVASEKAIQVYQQQKAIETNSAQRAADSIILPRVEDDGTKVEQHISADLKSHLSIKDIEKVRDVKNKTFTVNVQLKDMNLTSDYINGQSEPGISYYNMLSYYINVLQVKEIIDNNPGYSIIDSEGNKLTADYINELAGLLKQINDFDPTTNLEYDWDSAYDTDAFKNDETRGGTDVIATSKEGNVKLSFHIDSHGWWGYDLGAHDSITGLVMGYGAEEANEKQHELTMKYGNFFVIKMKEDKAGTWYMLNNTDLENPMIYVSKDGKEAFMIDVDFYGANVLNEKIKAVIGDKCESLKIFCTHNHGDHVNNLAVIGQDDYLRSITTIVWPENEPHTVLTDKDGTVKSMVGKDLISDIKWKGVETVKDLQKFKVAGVQFQFVEIPDEHTPGGGQLADLTHKVIYSGDSLGAQVHLGGTTIRSGAQQWLDGAKKAAKYIKEHGIKYNIGAHTPYLNNPDFASWLATGIEYAMKEAPEGYTLVIVENGKVVNGTDRYKEIMMNGLTDREELNICSLGFIKEKTDAKPSEQPNQTDSNNKDTKKPEETKNNATVTSNKSSKKVKTGDDTEVAALVGMMVLAGGTICLIKRKKEN